MVCVCPPQTSMNLNSSPAASSVIDLTNARAAAGSRNSSTNFISSLSSDFGFGERFDLLLVVLAHLLNLLQCRGRFLFVDLGHRKADMHQHPVADLQIVVGEQSHTDVAAHTVDVDFGQRLLGVDDVDHLPRYSQTHREYLLSALCSSRKRLIALNRSAATGRRRACRRFGCRRTKFAVPQCRAVRARSRRRWWRRGPEDAR